MACYLIGGVGGYVGSRLAARLLAEGHRVRGLVRDAETDTVQRLASRGMVVWNGDVTCPESLIGVADGVDYVYNLTSCSVLSNGMLHKTFVDGNQHLIAACSRARTVRAFVFTSNVAPYGDAGDQLVSEDTPPAPTCALGRVMAAAEQMIMQLVRRHNFPAMVLRLGTIYGPGRDLADALHNHTLTVFGEGNNYVSRIHIDDLLTVLARVVHDGQPGAIYNVADDTPMRLRTLYTAIQQRTGGPPPQHCALDRALAAGINDSIVAQASASVRLSNARLKHDLGIELRYPSYISWLDEQHGPNDEPATSGTVVPSSFASTVETVAAY
jgi:nucleoside-diphosphate-sugar epimerase